ncbi:MAG: hypothetical protein U0931_30475 [Vulcanimicrobiota bacterium]
MKHARIWRSLLKGAGWGFLAALSQATYLHFSFQAFSLAEGAGLEFGGLIFSFCGGSALLGPKLQPTFDPTLAAVVAAIVSLTFSLMIATLAVACGIESAALGGLLLGAALGLSGGLLQEA